MDVLQGARDEVGSQIDFVWRQIREPLLVPMLRLAVFLCLGMSLMMLFERIYMGIVISLVKVFCRKPEKRYKWDTIKDDVELGNCNYPMVLVQVPMYNEREVYKYILQFRTRKDSLSLTYIIFYASKCMQVYQLSIGAACGLSWPSDRVIIQILDDSTDPTIKVYLYSFDTFGSDRIGSKTYLVFDILYILVTTPTHIVTFNYFHFS